MNKKGWIIYNGNLYTQKFKRQVDWLKRTAESSNFEIDTIPNNQLLVQISQGKSGILTDKEKPDFVYFWDKDLYLASELERQGLRLFNSKKTIEICDDKALTYLHLQGAQIPMPKTIIAPKVYQEAKDTAHLDLVAREIGFPMVIKESFGSFGEQVYLIHNQQELLDKVTELNGTAYIFQEFIASSYGKDIRLHVIGDQVVAAMLREAENDFRANVTAGANMYPYQPSIEEKELAVTCSKLVGADFAGVDLLFGKDGQPILCEINSNAHFKNIYDCTGIDITKDMMAYIGRQLDGGNRL